MRYLALILFLPLCGCQPKANSPTLDKESIKQEVREMFDNYHADMKATGLQGEFKYLDQSEDFFWVPPGYGSALSYDSVRAILLATDLLVKDIDLHWQTLELFPLSRKIVNYSGIVGGTMTDTANNTVPVSVIESGTIIKRPDGWKLLSGQSATLQANPILE